MQKTQNNPDKLLIANWQNTKCQQSINQLILKYLNLIYSIVRAARGYNLDEDDLTAQGLLGFLKGINRFNLNSAYEVSTYINWWIKAEIYDFIFKNSFAVKVYNTKDNKKLFYKLRSIKNNLGLMGNLNMEDAQNIANKLSVKPGKVLYFDNLFNQGNYSLDLLLETSQQNFTGLDNHQNTSINYEQSMIEKNTKSNLILKLKKLINNLNPREKLIFYYRRVCNPNYTLDKIALKIGLTKERVRQIDNLVLNKLQERSKIFTVG